MRGLGLLLLSGTILTTGSALADERPVAVEQVVVTATRIPVEEQKLAAMMTQVSGADMRARGANDLRTTMALVSGVEAPSGGDAGPASAVPSFWGLHEFDAFLLVVDGVPWGGAFNPAIGSLDLNNVERVEVLKGAAPVTFGQTALVGVIQVIHSRAGEAAPELNASIGGHGSYSANVVTNLPAIGNWKQSVSLGAETQGFSDHFERVRDYKGLYRLAGPLAGGDLRVDLDFSLRRDRPQSPTVREEDGGLTTLTPLNANFNPADGRIYEDRLHGAVAYDHATPLGAWSTLASLAYTQVHDVRGFLRAELLDDGSANADYQNQQRRVLDGYLDTHLAHDGPFGTKLMVGADMLYGVGRQISRNGEYYVPLNGQTRAPATSTLAIDETNTLRSTRVFSGQYLQMDWTPDGPLSAFVGLRVNETNERRNSGHIDSYDATANESAGEKRIASRITGNAGASYRVWKSGADHLTLFADYRNSGQPGSIDFGPDYTPDILSAERAQSYEAGFKGALLDGRLSYEAAAFRLDDRNLEIATTDANGLPILENAGGERLHGVEAEAHYRAARDLDLFVSGSWHDAYFTKYIANEAGQYVDVSGKKLTLSPDILASAGAIYSPDKGLGGSVVINHVGKRYLDLANTATASAYTTVDASVSYRLKNYRFSISGSNLTDRRDPTTGSEFGDQSYYRMPGRKIMVGVQMTM